MIQKIKNSSFFLWAVIVLVGAYYIYALNPSYIFTGDSLNKLLQADSLSSSGFKTEDLKYNASDIDPDFQFYPFPGAYHIVVENRHLGQYPIFFSFFSAQVLKVFPPEVFPFIGFGFFLILLFVLQREFQVTNFIILLAAFFTYLLPLSLDYSENIYTVFLTFLGLTLYIRNLDKPQIEFIKMLFAGALIGLGVWLRLEGIFFFLSLFVGFLFVYRLNNKTETIRFFLFGLGFSIITILFFAFNFIDYGHIFGPRYLANKDGFTQTVLERIQQVITLLFVGKFKVGYFVFTPLLLVSLYYFCIPKNFKEISNRDKMLLVALVIFLPFVAVAAPNDGIVTWGPRYLAHAVLPNLILLHTFLEKSSFYKNEWKLPGKILFYISLFISLVLFYAGFKFTTVATKQLKQYQTEIDSVKADIRIFQNFFLINHTGTSYLKTVNLLISKEEELTIFLKNLKEKNKKGTVVFYNSDFHYIKDPNLNLYKMKPEEKESYLNLLGTNLKFIQLHKLQFIEVYEYKIE